MMKTKITNWNKWLFILLVSLIPYFSNGQGWEKLITGEDFTILYQGLVKPDSTYYIPTLIDGDFRMVRYDNNGYVLAAPSLSQEELFSQLLIISDDGHFIRSRSLENPNSIRLTKYDETGNIIWQHDLGAYDWYLRTTALLQDGNGDYVFAGGTGNPGPVMGYITKVDESGNTMWFDTIPGSDLIFDYRAAETADGGYLAAGGYPTDTDTLTVIAKYSSDGNLEWSNTDYKLASINAVAGVNDGGLAILGSAEDTYVVVRLNSDGTEQEVISLPVGCFPRDMAATGDGGIAVVMDCALTWSEPHDKPGEI